MSIKERISFINIEEKDIEELIPIMKCAFDEDSKIHLGEEGGPEGYDNGEFIRKWGLSKESEAYKILLDNETIGLAILWINNETKENFLGNIFIEVNHQNEGLGEAIWNMIEEKFTYTKVWRTETPGFSKRNHYFYVMKCGFKIIKINNPKDKYESNYIFEKVMN